MTRAHRLGRLLGTLIAVSTLAAAVSGFQQSEILTNAAIVKLVTERVPAASIAAKIQSTPNAFDVSPSALVNLYQSRVPADVISAMLKAQSRTPALDNDGVIAMVAARLPSKLILEKIAMSPQAFDVKAEGVATLMRNRVAPEVISAIKAAGPKGGPPTQPATIASVTAPTNPPNTAGAPVDVTATPPKATPLPRVNVPGPTPVAPVPVSAISITRVGDDETAVIASGLSVAAALDKVQAYFRSRNIGVSVGLDGHVLSGWFNERSCGPSLVRCQNRANVLVRSDDGRTTITVQVFERSRIAAPNPKPWTENAKSKGKETSETAIAIQTFIK